MKRILILLFTCIALTPVAHAQDVYNYVLATSTKIVNSPTSNYTQTQIAQFKKTALIYMKQKAIETNGSVSTDFLNTQAYYLSEFITCFFANIIVSKGLKDAQRKERIMLFMDASVSNPLFDDNDQETTMSFITNGGEITPFCLNTDWQKAYTAVQSQIK